LTKASIDGGDRSLEVIVDGDSSYCARTTRKAVELLLTEYGPPTGKLVLEQSMGVPVGCGFGASAAAAISGVYAASAAMGLRVRKRTLAYFAHVADIVEGTGLGTVSVTYDNVGAGAITKAGAPGLSEFFKLRCPPGTRIVTASIAPYRKSDALSSPEIVKRISGLGDSALRRLRASPSFGTLASEGERFSEALGLISGEVRGLLNTAKASGAAYASQNMIGHAIHAITTEARADAVAAALRGSISRPLVGVFELGRRRARVLRGN